MKKVKYLMLLDTETDKTTMLVLTDFTMVSTNNGTLSTLMKCQVHQREENSTLISISLLRDLSMLSQDYQEKDISISLEEEWSSRLLLLTDKLSSGGSTKRPKLSRTGRTKDGHGTSQVLEDQITSKLGTPTQDGGKSLDTKTTLLSISRTTRLLMFQEEEIQKVTVLESGERMVQRLNSGLSSIKIGPRNQEHKALTQELVLISIDHSTSNQECQ